MCAIEAQLENMMGTFHCKMKGKKMSTLCLFGHNITFNSCGHIVTVSTCSRFPNDHFFTVLPHWNAMPYPQSY